MLIIHLRYSGHPNRWPEFFHISVSPEQLTGIDLFWHISQHPFIETVGDVDGAFVLETFQTVTTFDLIGNIVLAHCVALHHGFNDWLRDIFVV